MKKRKKLIGYSVILAIVAIVIFVLTTSIFAGITLPQLKSGSTGTPVYALQYLLKESGYSVTVDGQFGADTLSKVKSFQEKSKLAVDGVVGTNTWNALFVTVKSGSSNTNAVKAVQYVLTHKHGYSLSVDGVFGPKTLEAVKGFQKNSSITADGIVGPTTWTYLLGSTTNTPSKFTYSNIKKAMENKGYKFYTGNYNINIVGIRGTNRVSNSWDDTLCVLYQENNSNAIKVYDNFTTDPGSYYLQNPMNSSGCAILVAGQYNGVYKIAIHNNKYEAVCQRNGNVKVYRDNNKDNILNLNSSTIQTGMFGINIHHGNNSSAINKYSAGCQVIKSTSDFQDFMNICYKSRDIYGNSFTYTLLNYSDL